MSLEEQKKAHQEICRLWQRYQDLTKAVITLRGELDDLDKAISTAGQRIYTLYKKSTNGLNGERIDGN